MQQKPANISIDESVLVQQCRQGDLAAVERLILKYQGRIYNVILRICANADDAAELTQDAFVKIIENIAGFQGRSSFYTWAFKIAVNLALNHCKKSIRLGFRSLDAGEDTDDGSAKQQMKDFLSDESSPDPSVAAENKEFWSIVEKALMKLNEAQRTVVILRDIEGMDYAQIAEVLSLELGTVKSRISRARSNLRDILEAVL